MNEFDATSSQPGCLVAPDDLEIGQHYAVHSLRQNPGMPLPIAGEAFRLIAVQLPFVVGQLVAQDAPLTIDLRFINIMRVSEQFAVAQRPTTPARHRNS